MPGPYQRWNRIADLLRLSVVSPMVENIDAPINVMLVGPPGDGKTAMLLRAQRAPNVEVLSDATYLGLISYVKQVQAGVASALVIPDLGTLAGRRGEVARQAVATLAMMCAEGIRTVRVGRRVQDYGGAKSAVLTAITPEDLAGAYAILSQNAFFSRVLLVNLDLEWTEQYRMMERKHLRLDRSLLALFRFPKVRRDRNGLWRVMPVVVGRGAMRQSFRWWSRLRKERLDRWFAFRTGDVLVGLLQSTAYLHGRQRVGREDMLFVRDRILPLIREQVKLSGLVGERGV